MSEVQTRPDRPPPPRPTGIPQELAERPQWVLWKHDRLKNGKYTKVPYQAAKSWLKAESDNPSTWGSLDDAWNAYLEGGFDGIGYMFAADDPYFGVDVDHCLQDGKLLEWAVPIIEQLELTYGEVSPSQTGIKFYARGKLPGRGKKRKGFGPDGTGGIELYDQKRYFAVTGHQWRDSAGIVDLNGTGDKLYQLACERPAKKKMEDVKAAARGLFARTAHEQTDSEERAIRYLAKVEPAIDGQGGSDVTFRAAIIGHEFGIDANRWLQILLGEYNPRCVGPWTDKELQHKVESAYDRADKPFGWRVVERDQEHEKQEDDGQEQEQPSEPATQPAGKPQKVEVNEAVDDPHSIARIYLRKHCTHPDGLMLRFYKDEFLRWEGAAYRPVPTKEVNAHLNGTAKTKFDGANKFAIEQWLMRGERNELGKVCPMPQAKKVGTRLIGDVNQALTGLTLLKSSIEPAAWLNENPPFDARETIPCRNALVHLPSLADGKSAAIVKPTPAFFSTYALDYDFDANAPEPVEWLRFLGSLWPNDAASIDTLGEFFGYCLTADTRQEKLLCLIGPRRAGKDTIARILRAMIGPDNVAGPTLSSLATNFGLWPLIGKPVAIISDARLSGRSDMAVIVERILTITGESTLTIDRKNREPWTGKLPTRLVIISNEMPKLSDASGGTGWSIHPPEAHSVVLWARGQGAVRPVGQGTAWHPHVGDPKLVATQPPRAFFPARQRPGNGCTDGGYRESRGCIHT